MTHNKTSCRLQKQLLHLGTMCVCGPLTVNCLVSAGPFHCQVNVFKRRLPEKTESSPAFFHTRFFFSFLFKNN
uniref:Uncharacterized protein n=1 Tax=Anguilla anguilla TaxID=7936 RepID=A0A0E9WAS8_ANGAN